MRLSFAVLVVAILSASMTVAASMPALAQDAATETEGSTRLLLTEMASREAEQNTLVAILAARAEDLRPGPAQNEVNATMAGALDVAEDTSSVRAATGSYRVFEQHGRDGKRIAWIAEQDLRLTSMEPAALLELVGRLQERKLLLRSLIYRLSPEARRALEDELVLEAIARVRSRTAIIASALDLQVVRFETVAVGDAAIPVPRPSFDTRTAVAAEAMSAPVATPDLETVSVSVDVEVVLAPGS